MFNLAGYIYKSLFSIILPVLFIAVLIFYNVYAFNIADNFLREKTEGRRMTVDLICDVAEAGGSRDALIAAITGIDSAGNKGTYAAVFDADYNILTDRSPYFEAMNFNPLNDGDFARDVAVNNRGRYQMAAEYLPDAPLHPINMYFRWVFRDTDAPLVVIVGVSKYAVETDTDGGLITGAWIIAAAFTVSGTASVIAALRKRRRRP